MSIDEHTPTTDQVREAWAEMSGWDLSLDESDAAFNRWLGGVSSARDAEVAERIAQEADQAWKDGSWSLTRGTGDWIRSRIAREAGRA